MAMTGDEIDALKAALREPYRIYKPLFIDPNFMKRDLDREFESISQALIQVSNRLEALEARVKVLEAKP